MQEHHNANRIPAPLRLLQFTRPAIFREEIRVDEAVFEGFSVAEELVPYAFVRRADVGAVEGGDGDAVEGEFAEVLAETAA